MEWDEFFTAIKTKYAIVSMCVHTEIHTYNTIIMKTCTTTTRIYATKHHHAYMHMMMKMIIMIITIIYMWVYNNSIMFIWIRCMRWFFSSAPSPIVLTSIVCANVKNGYVVMHDSKKKRMKHKRKWYTHSHMHIRRKEMAIMVIIIMHGCITSQC